MLAARKLIDETVSGTQNNAKANLKLYSDARTSKKVRRQKELKNSILICVSAILCMSLVYTSLEAKVTTVGFEINNLQKQIAEVENINNRLMLEVEEKSSPAAIAEFAKTQEGMIASTEKNIIYQDFDGATSGLQVASSMSTIAPGQGVASVEVLEDEASHPVLDAFSSIFSKFNQDKNTQVGQLSEQRAK